MKCLFVNGSSEPQCGVNQFGKNLYAILKDSENIQWHYHEALTVEDLQSVVAMHEPSCLLVNWQSGQGGVLSGAPFAFLNRPQYLCYHDNDINENAWDGILFSDPTMTPRGKWHSIGRPLPEYKGQSFSEMANSPIPNPELIIGVNGFIGAFADQVVHKALQEVEYGTVRLLLPYATYGDADGSQARTMANRCRNMVNNSGITLEISHEFLPQPKLLEWLAGNTINVYIRPTNMNWRGVSSAPDSAIAVKRPIAVNKCNAFRHLFDCTPSICVEDNSLMEIIGNGLSPTLPLANKWSPENVRADVERVLMSV